jgi:hypothetical protein
MSPEPPFLKAVTFTLMGLPQVQAGCVPMFETGINVLNLPLISKFVNYAIGETFLFYESIRKPFTDNIRQVPPQMNMWLRSQ